jgi:RNA ligase
VTTLTEIMDESLLNEMFKQSYVRAQYHAREPLVILNYTATAQYDRVWNPVTRQCRGLIVRAGTAEIVCRPWPKFYNYGEHEEGSLDYEAPVEVTDKMDGSLGILYPTADGWAIATRGSFTSDQALRATKILQERYPDFTPSPEYTYLFEILLPENRVVIDYGEWEDLVQLGVIHTHSGEQLDDGFIPGSLWPGPHVHRFSAKTLTEALALPPRPNAEGIVVRYPSEEKMVKIKQDDYVALHRIVTGLNERSVWEIAAVEACKALITEPQYWGSYLGIDPERAKEIMALESNWLDNVPDEFYAWVEDVTSYVQDRSMELHAEGIRLGTLIGSIPDKRARYEMVKDNPLVREIMRYADGRGPADMKLKSWRLVQPSGEGKPYQRSEDVA